MWPCSQCQRERESGSYEWTGDTITALAADPEGVLAVEALMCEAASRLAFVPDLIVGPIRWSVYRPGEYYWHLFGTGRERWVDPPIEMWPLAQIARKPVDDIARTIETFERACDAHPRARRWSFSASKDVVRELGWNALAASGATFFSSRPNPFTPLVDIWARGYVPCGWEYKGPLFLAAPPVQKWWRCIADCKPCLAWPDKIPRGTDTSRLAMIAGDAPSIRRCDDCGTYYRLDDDHTTRLTPREARALLPAEERSAFGDRYDLTQHELSEARCQNAHDETLRTYARRAFR